MEYRLSKLSNDFETIVEIDEAVKISEEIDDFFLKPESDLFVKGTMRAVESGVFLAANGACSFLADCARCGKEITVDISFDVNHLLISEKQENDDSDEIVFIEEDSFSPSEIVLQGLFLNLSVKYLCKADCKGLCMICGMDLNGGDCVCEKETADSRFAVLQTLLEKRNMPDY